MIDYESPVKVFQDEIQMQIENEIMKAVYGVGVAVDKEELLKALKYDREQYEKGFSDCETTYKKKIEDVLERLEEEYKAAADDMKRCLRENPLQFDSAKGCAQGLYNAIKIIKERML